MKKWISAWMIAMLCAAGCSHKNKPASTGVDHEVETAKQHDRALLLVTFGSSWDKPHETFQRMKTQFAAAFPTHDVYLAFTSGICRKRCAENGKGLFYSPEEWLQALGRHEYRHIDVQSLHIIPGEEYRKIVAAIEAFKQDPIGQNIEIALGGPLLNSEADITELARNLHALHAERIAAGHTVVFMGHGNELEDLEQGNGCYPQLEAALQTHSPRYFVGTVDMPGNDIEAVMTRMKAAGIHTGEVFCQPLLSVVGDHATNDMKGGNEEQPEEGSWRHSLIQAGYTCTPAHCLTEGLADFPENVTIWMSHVPRP